MDTIEDIVEVRSGLSRVFEEIAESRKTVAGITVSPEMALQCSAILACVRVISESVAALPFSLYRRLMGGGKEIAYGMPLHTILSEQPNGWMTSFEFRELMQSWALLWGAAYAEIRPGRFGSVTELWPLHPSRMKVERISNGRLRFLYTEPNSPEPTVYRQDQIFRLPWMIAGCARRGAQGVCVWGGGGRCAGPRAPRAPRPRPAPARMRSARAEATPPTC